MKSAVNHAQPLRLCLGCARYAWGMDGKGPAEHDKQVWACVDFMGSLSGAQKATPTTDATVAGVYHQQKELANE